jgi:predicted flap endonuclease-1-like 5' DNA nuclease
VRRLIRALGIVAGAAAVVYLMRDKLVRIPAEPEPPPHFKGTSPNGETADARTAAAAALADDLTEITGIGPAYAGRLRATGIESFAQLAEADPQETANAIDVSEEQVANWVEQARTRIG